MIHINSTSLQSKVEGHQRSSELDWSNNSDHHPSLDSNSSSFANAAGHNLSELMSHYQQRHAELGRIKHWDDVARRSKIACFVSQPDETLAAAN
jgi:hypothetical protein